MEEIKPISSRLLVAYEYPDELALPFNEISRICPHKNFKIPNNNKDCDHPMDDGDIFYLRFFKDSTKATQRCFSVYTSSSELIQTTTNTTTDDLQYINVNYHEKIDAFRALGRIFSRIASLTTQLELPDFEDQFNFSEESEFLSVGTMIDVSRGAVMSIDTVCYLIQKMALMGYTTLQLYTEDTYEIEGEPFFGYLRGRYTSDELILLDNYANDFGIEMFPCIQTLGHLGQILQWPKYSHLRDNSEVLLVGLEETYILIEKMLKSISKCFRSKRIHIGMDEAAGVGEGRYKIIFGDRDPNLVFLEHLMRVNDICLRLGLQPLVWSDMLFTLAAKNSSLESYYTQDHVVNASQIPKNLNLVYWDYYHTNWEVYSKQIIQHRKLGCEPWVAGGVWTWNRFFTALPFSFVATKACMEACKKHEIKNVFVTLWGDDGNECDFYSSLAGLLYFAEHSYTKSEEINPEHLSNQFLGIFGGNIDDWVKGAEIDMLTDIPIDNNTHFPPNISKWLMWQDVVYSIYSPQLQHYNMEDHFKKLDIALQTAITRTPQKYPLNVHLKFPQLICKVLTLKTDISSHLQKAYLEKDKTRTLELCQGPLTDLTLLVEQLSRYHTRLWLSLFKPFGMEIVQARYGSLRIRLESLKERLVAWAGTEKGSADEKRLGVAEFLVERECVFAQAGAGLVLDYSRAFTPSRSMGGG